MASQKDYIDELKSQIEFLQLECDILNSQHKHKEKHKKKHKDKHNEGSRGRSGAQIPSDASLQRPVLLNKENAGSNESRPHTQSTSQQLKGVDASIWELKRHYDNVELDHANAIRDKNTQLSELRAQLEDVRHQLQISNEEKVSALVKAQGIVDKRESGLKQRLSKVIALEQDVLHLKEEVKGWKTKHEMVLREKEAIIGEMTGKVQELANTVEDLETNLRKATKEKGLLQATIANDAIQVFKAKQLINTTESVELQFDAKLKSSVAVAGNEFLVDSLKEELAVAEQAQQMKDARIAQLETELEKIARVNAKLLQESSLAKQKLADVVSRENKISSASEEAIRLQKEAEHKLSLVSTNPEETSKIQRLLETRDSNEKEIANLSGKIEFQNSQLSSLKNELAGVQKEEGVLKERLASFMADEEIFQMKLTELRSEVMNLNRSLSKEASAKQQLALKCNELQEIVETSKELQEVGVGRLKLALETNLELADKFHTILNHSMTAERKDQPLLEN